MTKLAAEYQSLLNKKQITDLEIVPPSFKKVYFSHILNNCFINFEFLENNIIAKQHSQSRYAMERGWTCEKELPKHQGEAY